MDYKKYSTHAYNLHVIKTNKFKKTYIKIVFKNKINREDIVYRKLLGTILLESNSIYKTKRLLDIKTEELYNLNAVNSVKQTGNVIEFSAIVAILNDKYADNLFNDSVEYITDVLFKPYVKDDRFDTKVFNNAKTYLKETIESFKENKPAYATYRCLNEMDNGPFSYLPVGYIEDLEKITESSLYEYYKNMLKKDILDIYVVGDVDYDFVFNIVKKNIPINTIKRNKVKYYLKHTKLRNRYKKVIEDIDANQSTLVVGNKMDNLTNFERQYVLPVYNYILGGGPDSKLFRNVREKNSLCYSISSSARMISNVLLITSGVDKNNAKKCFRLIKKEMTNIKNGDFTDEDIKKAILTYVNSTKEMEDSPYSILTNYMTIDTLDFDNMENSLKNIYKINKKMITKLASKIHPDLVYLLKGDSNE